MNYTHFLIEKAVNNPTRPCLHYKEGDQWSYYNWTKLKDKTAQAANGLRSLGIKTDDNVGIYAENMAEWIVFDLAIASLGAVTVPIYATNTADQAAYIINDAEIKVVLVGDELQYDNILKIYPQNKFLKTILVAKTDVLLKTTSSYLFNSWISQFSKELVVEKRSEEDLATIIYTSGTTGEPKGVMLTHGNFIKAFDSHQSFFKFKNPENEHSLSFLPLSHVFERSWALFILYIGGQIYMLENPKLIASALKEVRPTMMCSVPRLYQKIYNGLMDKIHKSSLIKRKIFGQAIKIGAQYSENIRQNKKSRFGLKFKHFLAEKMVFKKVKAEMGGRLWFMPVGGAALSPEITQFFDALGIHLTIGYGLTETCATVTCYPFTGYQYGTAGIPLDGVQFKIGDENEIWVKGNGVMKGYYKKPEETAAVFTQDGWFKTGDSGTTDSFGNLVVVDRIKDLMKTSNGKYIAPQPIENMLTNDNYIQQALVIGDDKPYVTALLVPNFEALQELAHKLELKFESLEELIDLQKIKDFYTEKVNKLQEHLPNFEKIKHFRLLPKEFNMDLGEITPTLKVKRNIVIKKFKKMIEDMYK